jgi:hypothetical protein
MQPSGMQLEGNECADSARYRYNSIGCLAARCLKGLLCTKPRKRCPAANGKQPGVIHIRLTLQHQVGNPDQCDENACNCEGEPVDLFHRAPHDADSARRRLSMSFQDADNGRPSASAHNSRTFSSAINALNSCLNCTVEGI